MKALSLSLSFTSFTSIPEVCLEDSRLRQVANKQIQTIDELHGHHRTRCPRTTGWQELAVCDKVLHKVAIFLRKTFKEDVNLNVEQLTFVCFCPCITVHQALYLSQRVLDIIDCIILPRLLKRCWSSGAASKMAL